MYAVQLERPEVNTGVIDPFYRLETTGNDDEAEGIVPPNTEPAPQTLVNLESILGN